MDLKKFTELLTLFVIGVINRVSGDTCSAGAMSRCTDPLRVVTDNKDLGFATSQVELEQMCPKLMDGLRCIDNFTRKCLEQEHRAYFNTLYTGTTQVIVDLCKPGPYQTEYLQHAPCMRKAQAEYESCADDYQLRIKTLNQGGVTSAEEEETNVMVLCCSFQRYLHCSEKVVNSTCGQNTARFTKGFLDRMSGPLVQGHCQDYSMGSDMCTNVDKFSPRSSQQSSNNLYSITSSAASTISSISFAVSLLAATFLMAS